MSWPRWSKWSHFFISTLHCQYVARARHVGDNSWTQQIKVRRSAALVVAHRAGGWKPVMQSPIPLQWPVMCGKSRAKSHWLWFCGSILTNKWIQMGGCSLIVQGTHSHMAWAYTNSSEIKSQFGKSRKWQSLMVVFRTYISYKKPTGLKASHLEVHWFSSGFLDSVGVLATHQCGDHVQYHRPAGHPFCQDGSPFW